MIRRVSPSILKIFKELNLSVPPPPQDPSHQPKLLTSINPHDNSELSSFLPISPEECKIKLGQISRHSANLSDIPMPKRGDILRQIGEKLRLNKFWLANLITLETGKIISEGLGEIQEVIDMCDFACGLSRQIGGFVFPSERKSHTLLECWHPLGLVGVISAFNFPAAVFGWNFCLSFLCGNATAWKGSPSTPIITYALSELIKGVLEANGIKKPVFEYFLGEKDIGELIVSENCVSLVSFTGSTKVGRAIGPAVQARFGKAILELGGNNPIVVSKDANLELALKASVFSALGTSGQRCTSLRRLFVHQEHYESFRRSLLSAYKNVRIGNPLDPETNFGPVHSKSAVELYFRTLKEIERQGGRVVFGGNSLKSFPQGNYVEPTIVEIPHESEIVRTESFVPILYLFKYKELEEAVNLCNSVPQGLSASIFTNNLKEVFKFIGPHGAWNGIVNVNVGTSGAEIGGAFGGEKETGGGRESGSDAWKQYMRRVTCTVNFGNELPLSQGINFEVNTNQVK